MRKLFLYLCFALTSVNAIAKNCPESYMTHQFQYAVLYPSYVECNYSYGATPPLYIYGNFYPEYPWNWQTPMSDELSCRADYLWCSFKSK